MNNILYIAGVLASMMQLPSASLLCASCDKVTCIPPPPTCEIGQRPCSCCMECRVGLGGECGPFSVEDCMIYTKNCECTGNKIHYMYCMEYTRCESRLVCLTNGGAFNGRPPYWFNLVGKCVLPSDLLPSSATPSQITPSLITLLKKNAD